MDKTSAIVYLLNNNIKDILNFRKSIVFLIDNYYTKYPCDIICFYEQDFPVTELYLLKNSLQNVSIYFEPIDFKIPNYSEKILTQIPEYFPHPDFPQVQGFSIGYRHMCRFFAGEIFYHPRLLDYRYVWRLDTDSFLLSDIPYNVFDRMAYEKAIYGYINIQYDHPGVINQLWKLSKQYFTTINKNDIFKSSNIDFHKNKVFYTNFEIFDMDWFRSCDYQNFYRFIDDSGGIYIHRWGDHSIRYIGLNSLATPDQFCFFNDIRYFHHQEYYNRQLEKNYNAS